MRVLYVVAGLGWTGGMQEYAAGIARGMADLGHEVRILSGGRPPPAGPPPHPLAEGLDIVWHPKQRVLGRYIYPEGLARSIHVHSRWADLVHTHQPFFIGTWIAATTRTPLAANFHLHPEHLAGRPARRRRLQLAAIIRRIDLLAGSSGAELELASTVRLPRRAVTVWPGIDRPVGVIPRTNERPLLLSVGRLDEAKGIERTLEAFMRLSERCELAVVGEGPLSTRLADQCRAAGLDPGQVLRGPLPDDELDALYRRADVLVSSSTQEAFGIVATKAVANGCRVVLSDIPPHREIVATLGLATALVPAGAQPAEIVQTIEDALRLPPPSDKIRRSVPTWHDSAAVLERAYEQVLGGLG